MAMLFIFPSVHHSYHDIRIFPRLIFSFGYTPILYTKYIHISYIYYVGSRIFYSTMGNILLNLIKIYLHYSSNYAYLNFLKKYRVFLKTHLTMSIIWVNFETILYGIFIHVIDIVLGMLLIKIIENSTLFGSFLLSNQLTNNMKLQKKSHGLSLPVFLCPFVPLRFSLYHTLSLFIVSFFSSSPFKNFLRGWSNTASLSPYFSSLSNCTDEIKK